MLQSEDRWGDEPRILIFADREQDCATARQAAESVGARVLGQGGIGAALARLEDQVAVDLVLIELRDAYATETDALLEWINAASRADDLNAVISFPRSMIDQVVARIDDPGVTILCDATLEDRTVAAATLLAERRHRLHDPAHEGDAERLRRLSDEVARIAASLAELSTSAKSLTYNPVRATADTSGLALDATHVRTLIRVRRLRDQFFSGTLFADPAWDMMLDLLAARLEGSRVAVSSLCIAAAVPPTTALRWIRTLTEQGLFERKADPEDGRRIFIELADPAADALLAYFQTAQQMGFQLG